MVLADMVFLMWSVAILSNVDLLSWNMFFSWIWRPSLFLNISSSWSWNSYQINGLDPWWSDGPDHFMTLNIVSFYNSHLWLLHLASQRNVDLFLCVLWIQQLRPFRDFAYREFLPLSPLTSPARESVKWLSISMCTLDPTNQIILRFHISRVPTTLTFEFSSSRVNEILISHL